MIFETRFRSILKAVSWRIFGSLITVSLIYLFTRRLDISVSVGALDTLLKIAIYFAHERSWNMLQWGRKPIDPVVVWFTGLSGSGKSTIADGVAAALRRRGLRVECLDGDGIRRLLPETGFTRPEREMHVRRVGHLASTLEKNGIFVVASLISPYRDSRRFVRGLCGNFIEVYVSTPLEVCEARDSKGLYAMARRGEKPHFTGIDDPYEPPEACEISVNTAQLSEEKAVVQVMDYLDRRFLNGSA